MTTREIHAIDKFQKFTFPLDPSFELRGEALPDGRAVIIAADVCRIGGTPNVAQAVSRLDDDEKCVIISNDVTGRPQKMLAVTQEGFLSLVLGFRVRKGHPNHERLKVLRRWVTHEVLPSILKTGTYSMGQSSKELSVFEINRQMLAILSRANDVQEENKRRQDELEQRQEIVENNHRALEFRHEVKAQETAANFDSLREQIETVRALAMANLVKSIGQGFRPLIWAASQTDKWRECSPICRTFIEWAASTFQMGESSVYAQLAVARIERNVNVAVGSHGTDQMHCLAELPPEFQERAFLKACQASDPESPTETQMRAAIAKVKADEGLP